MPLNSPTNDQSPPAPETGVLFIVATPIGNMDDITLRAINTLERVDIIAAEDTRQTKKLLSHLNIRARLISYHEHNEEQSARGILKKLKSGSSVALVSPFWPSRHPSPSRKSKKNPRAGADLPPYYRRTRMTQKA